MDAMKRLEDNSRPNLVLKFCQGLAMDRPNNAGPLIPIHRMPFALIQDCIEFFTCTNVMQIGVTSVYCLFCERNSQKGICMLYCCCSLSGDECRIISQTAAGIEVYGLYGCQTLLNLLGDF